ncbi:PGF-CTERM sorting domain-containing protein [Natrinema halophilum]|uniref:PGF-CTERM sorting domain-containing protein n=1 Tax=Natrinema halophilum TaxID=1699371 RepID=A0A7D5KYN1_9EURY|nr:PGF-CTERM sorting domain-containing protein [Natrinema halophilum]QLG51082.1 PGF-CTERM sorting domain-containing protein [Natrinema halophilum]
MDFSSKTKAVVGMACLAMAVFGMAVIVPSVSAATNEMANESVTFDNESNVTVSVAWNESITDPANESASVTFYNATEWENDPANATVVLSDTIAASAGNTTNATYTESDGLVDGAEYRLIVEANDSAADSVSVDQGSVGGLFSGDGAAASSAAGLAAIVVLLAGAGWIATREE